MELSVDEVSRAVMSVEFALVFVNEFEEARGGVLRILRVILSGGCGDFPESHSGLLASIFPRITYIRLTFKIVINPFCLPPSFHQNPSHFPSPRLTVVVRPVGMIIQRPVLCASDSREKPALFEARKFRVENSPPKNGHKGIRYPSSQPNPAIRSQSYSEEWPEDGKDA